MIGALVALGRLLFGKLGLCALAGALVGGGTGAIFGVYLPAMPSPGLTAAQSLQVGLLFGLLGWLAVLLVIGVWLRYGARNIALWALFVAVFTAVLTVYLNVMVNQPALATVLGMVVGIVVGTALCWLRCWRSTRALGATTHGSR